MIPFHTKLCGATLILFFFATSALGVDIRSTKHNATSGLGVDVRSTKHNLSISGPGPINASSESQICIFCHIPHQKGSAIRYLWNRFDPANPYIPYFSSTLRTDVVGQPTGASRMCLSCHDGTIALGEIASSPTEIPFKGGIRFMPEDSSSYLGTDLSDDHPISFVYDEMLSLDNRQIRDPSALPPQVKLKNNQLQCTACHDPHDNTYGQFLVMDNTASSLCTACHDRENWINSSHARSTASLDRTGGLWPNTDYATVGENGCENCHRPHAAGSNERLLLFAFEEDNCLDCHDGTVASADIASVLAKPYRHGVQDYTGVHDAAEDFTLERVPKHVECSDCHNAHQANGSPSPGGGVVSGSTRGVSGVSAAGQSVTSAQYLYEICFKCHGDIDNNVISTLPVTRQISDLNTRISFAPANPSFHPVETRGKNPDVPSLIPPYTVASIISCTDCHGNSDSLDPPGPHGSDYQYLLTNRYITDDNTPESPSSYALCYQCHSRSVLILGGVSFEHRLHVVDQKAPCSACHAPHGISAMQGNALNNSHLINFDLAIVSPTDTGRLEYIDLGRRSGQCFLRCHGILHNPISYPG